VLAIPACVVSDWPERRLVTRKRFSADSIEPMLIENVSHAEETSLPMKR
jgi:hypothetical protein